MPRKSPFSEQRPPRYQEVKTLTDPVTGEEDTLLLRHLDSPLEGVAMDMAARLVVQYVGFPDDGIPPQQEVFPMFHDLELSETLCRTAANIYVMQLPRPDGGAIYSLDELLAFAATDEAHWKALQKAANEVNTAGEKVKNARRASAGNGSLTPSDTDNLTRKSSPVLTHSFAESTNGSESSANTLRELDPATI